jgi:putative FmdB family regulatory protein
MPFYEYQCKQCGHQLEAMQKVNDTPLKKCPECGKPALQRLMSAPVFRLKGSGWYETDFKSDDEGKRNLAEKPEETVKPAEVKDDKKDAGKEAASATAGEKPAAPAAAATAPAADKPAKTPAKSAAAKPAAAKKSSRRGVPAARPKPKKPLKRAGAKR